MFELTVKNGATFLSDTHGGQYFYEHWLSECKELTEFTLMFNGVERTWKKE